MTGCPLVAIFSSRQKKKNHLSYNRSQRQVVSGYCVTVGSFAFLRLIGPRTGMTSIDRVEMARFFTKSRFYVQILRGRTTEEVLLTVDTFRLFYFRTWWFFSVVSS